MLSLINNRTYVNHIALTRKPVNMSLFDTSLQLYKGLTPGRLSFSSTHVAGGNVMMIKTTTYLVPELTSAYMAYFYSCLGNIVQYIYKSIIFILDV